MRICCLGGAQNEKRNPLRAISGSKGPQNPRRSPRFSLCGSPMVGLTCHHVIHQYPNFGMPVTACLSFPKASWEALQPQVTGRKPLGNDKSSIDTSQSSQALQAISSLAHISINFASSTRGCPPSHSQKWRSSEGWPPSGLQKNQRIQAYSMRNPWKQQFEPFKFSDFLDDLKIYDIIPRTSREQVGQSQIVYVDQWLKPWFCGSRSFFAGLYYPSHTLSKWA